MPRRIIKGVGMMQRESLQYDHCESGAIEACQNAWDYAVPKSELGDWDFDNYRRENFARCRKFLADAGLADLMDETFSVDTLALSDAGFCEADRPWIAAHWIGAFKGVMKCREQFQSGDTSPANMGMMLHYAEELGRLERDMWWRATDDPISKKAPEKLALGKRKQELSTGKASEKRRENAAENEPDWWDCARLSAMEIRERHPSWSRNRIAKLIAEEFRRSERQVRDVIKQVC